MAAMSSSLSFLRFLQLRPFWTKYRKIYFSLWCGIKFAIFQSIESYKVQKTNKLSILKRQTLQIRIWMRWIWFCFKNIFNIFSLKNHFWFRKNIKKSLNLHSNPDSDTSPVRNLIWLINERPNNILWYLSPMMHQYRKVFEITFVQS